MRRKASVATATQAVDTAITTNEADNISAEQQALSEALTTDEAKEALEEARRAERQANVLKFHNTLYETCKERQTKFTDSDEYIKATLRGNSCNIFIRSYKATGNSFITLYSSDGKRQLLNRQFYFDQDGQRIKDTINNYLKQGNVEELLSGNSI